VDLAQVHGQVARLREPTAAHRTQVFGGDWFQVAAGQARGGATRLLAAARVQQSLYTMHEKRAGAAAVQGGRHLQVSVRFNDSSLVVV